MTTNPLNRLLLVTPPASSHRLTDDALAELAQMVMFIGDDKTWWLPSDIAQELFEFFKLKFGAEEIDYALRTSDVSVVEASNGTPPQYRLTSQSIERFKALDEEVQTLETQVLDEWESGISDLILQPERDQFRSRLLNLNTAFLQLFAVNVILKDRQVDTGYEHQLKGLAKDAFQLDPDIQDVFEREVLRFWTQPTTLRSIYLAKLIDRATLIHSISLDEASSQEIMQHWEGIVLYLDTNVAFALLNFAGPESYHQIKSLLVLAEEAGIQIKVSACTVKELKSALKRHERDARRFPISDTQMAQLAAKHMAQDSFLRAYNFKYGASGTSIDEFEAYIRNVESYLEAEGVEVLYDDESSLPTYQEHKDEHLQFLGGVRGADIYREESDSKIEHDFRLWCLVEASRSGYSRSYGKAKAWLLTLHRRLSIYDEKFRQSTTDAPYFLNPARLFQVLRFVLPKASDETCAVQFVALLRSTIFAASYRVKDVVLQRLASNLSQQIESHRMNGARAAALFATLAVDKALGAELTHAKDSVAEVKAIDSALARSVEKLRESQEELVEKNKQERLVLEEQIAALQRDQELDAQGLKAVQSQLVRLKRRKSDLEAAVSQGGLFGAAELEESKEEIRILRDSLSQVQTHQIFERCDYARIFICIAGAMLYYICKVDSPLSLFMETSIPAAKPYVPNIVLCIAGLLLLVKRSQTRSPAWLIPALSLMLVLPILVQCIDKDLINIYTGALEGLGALGLLIYVVKKNPTG